MPNTVEGRKLLAHELTHVMQQANNGQDLSIVRRKLTTLGGEWEVEKFDYLNDPNMRGDAREIGVDMWLQFIPKPPVDATKIALVQIGRFILNGKPYFLEDKIREKRATPEGWAINQQAKIKNPNYAASGHGIDGEHYIDAGGKPHQKNAKLHDDPHLGGHGQRFISVFRNSSIGNGRKASRNIVQIHFTGDGSVPKRINFSHFSL